MNVINCAHRGASGKLPENTLAAFEAALRHGATALELDIWQCKSGELVVMHDETVERTTNGVGKIANLTLAELQKLDAGNGQRIPTLASILERFKGSGTSFFIEIKSISDPLLTQLVGLIERFQKSGDYTYKQLPVISFKASPLRKIKCLDDKIITGLSTGHRRVRHPAWLLRAKYVGAHMVNPRHSIISRAFVRKAHGAGLQVNTWAVNDPAEMRRLIVAGVDCIMTDHPDILREVLRKK